MFFILTQKERLLNTGVIEDNEYFKKYISIIENETREGYVESHHIIPECYYRFFKIPIDNSVENRVNLSPFLHILAHYYLYYCVIHKEFRNRLALAFVWMKNGQQGHLLTLSEQEFIEALPRYLELRNTNYWKGRKRSDVNKEAIRQAQYRRPPEVQQKMINSLKGRKRTPEQRARMSEGQKKRDKSKIKRGYHLSEKQKQHLREVNLGKKQSEETKQKRRDTMNQLKWYNNGVESVRRKICPDGYVEGRLYEMTQETKEKCSQAGRHWYTNGIVTTMADECPPGFRPGRI